WSLHRVPTWQRRPFLNPVATYCGRTILLKCTTNGTMSPPSTSIGKRHLSITSALATRRRLHASRLHSTSHASVWRFLQLLFSAGRLSARDQRDGSAGTQSCRPDVHHTVRGAQWDCRTT